MYIGPKNMVCNMSYKNSCELCGDVILITDTSTCASFQSAETVVN